jgi:hypothetical protein
MPMTLQAEGAADLHIDKAVGRLPGFDAARPGEG